MTSFNFWQKWLFGFGLYLVAFGFILAFFGQSSLMNFIFNEQIDAVFWGVAELAENNHQFQAWIYGVLGSVISGWGVFLAFMASYPFKAKEPWAWYCILIVFVVWFIIDTAISVHYEVTFNVFVNIAFLSFVLLPLIFTRKHFMKN